MPIKVWKSCQRGATLEVIDHLVPRESFRAAIEAAVLTPDELKKSSVVSRIFRTLVWAERRASLLKP
jgi:hypothetical protein